MTDVFIKVKMATKTKRAKATGSTLVVMNSFNTELKVKKKQPIWSICEGICISVVFVIWFFYF